MFDSILTQRKPLPLESSCRESVKHLLLMRFKGQIPPVEDVAEGMGMTVRSLQRKLSDEQTTFREIAGEVKKEIALHLIKNKAGTITEVAQVMGYNDLPAFRRAFKGWTRATPKEMKRMLHVNP